MTVDVRELTSTDAPALREFFASMPAQDRTFFFQDVDDPSVAERWVGDERGAPHGAFGADGTLVGFTALKPGIEWSSHVADVVLLVSPSVRRAGVGRTLARTMLLQALERGFKKVTVVIPADNSGAIEMFQRLGFEAEALLRDQLCSPEDGELRDVVVLAHMVEDQWATMLTGGYQDAVG